MSFPNDNYRSVGKRQVATVDEKQHSLNPVMSSRAPHYSKKKPDESRTGRPTFIEDFLLEHARSGQQSDSNEFAGCF